MNVLVYLKSLGLAMLIATLAGCASNSPAPVVDRSQSPAGQSAASSDAIKVAPVARKGYYIVKEGDTLYRVALDNGQAYRDVANWNNLDDPNKIRVGQELRVVAPEGEDAQPVAVTKPVGVATAIEQRTLDGNSDSLKTQPKAGRESYSDEALARLGKLGESALAKVELVPPVKLEPKPDVKAEAKPESKTQAGADDDVIWMWPASGKLAGQFVDGGSKGLDILGKKGDPVLAASDGKVVYSGSGLRGYGQLLIVKHNNTYLTAYAHNSKVLVKEGQTVNRGQKIAEMGDSETDQVKLHFEVRRQGKPVDPMKHLPPR